MQVPKVVCELCGQEISKSNYSKHIRRHRNHPETFNDSFQRLIHDGLTCQYCGKECKNKSSLVAHERLCKNNPTRMKTSYELHPEKYDSFCGKSCTAWNKGLTKDTDERVKNGNLTRLRRISSGEILPSFTGKHHSEKTKQILREYAIRNHLGGRTYKKNHIYNGVHFDSSYEVIVAKELDKNNILWEKSKSFTYIVDGISRHYTPDFYLPEYNVYLDPKNDFLIENVNPALGYKDLDKIKWVEDLHGIRVIVLDEHHLTWDSILELIYAPVA